MRSLRVLCHLACVCHFFFFSTHLMYTTIVTVNIETMNEYAIEIKKKKTKKTYYVKQHQFTEYKP